MLHIQHLYNVATAATPKEYVSGGHASGRQHVVHQRAYGEAKHLGCAYLPLVVLLDMKVCYLHKCGIVTPL
jgi:hypothetical protein